MRIALVLLIGALLAAPAYANTYDVVSTGSTWVASDGTTQPQSLCANKIIATSSSAVTLSGFNLVLDSANTGVCYTPPNTSPPLDATVALAIAAVQATIPTKGSAIPPGATPGGSVGVLNSFTPMDATPPGLTRSKVTTTDGSCKFSVTWGVPLISTSPVVNVVPVIPSTSTQPVICNPTLPLTNTGVSGMCFAGNTTLLNLTLLTNGLTLNPFSGACTGLSVSVFAREPTN